MRMAPGNAGTNRGLAIRKRGHQPFFWSFQYFVSGNRESSVKESKMPQMKKYLFTPGPAPVPPEVLLEMARPIIHHRTPEFSAALDQARERMKPLYGTSSEVILLSSSGTGAMEAAVINLLQPGEHAIYVNGGQFRERWGKVAAAAGMSGHEG